MKLNGESMLITGHLVENIAVVFLVGCVAFLVGRVLLAGASWFTLYLEGRKHRKLMERMGVEEKTIEC